MGYWGGRNWSRDDGYVTHISGPQRVITYNDDEVTEDYVPPAPIGFTAGLFDAPKPTPEPEPEAPAAPEWTPEAGDSA